MGAENSFDSWNNSQDNEAYLKMLPATHQIIQNDYMTYCHHNTNKPYPVNVDYKNLYLFNKPVKVYTLE